MITGGSRTTKSRTTYRDQPRLDEPERSVAEAVSGFTYRHRWPLLAAWLVVLALAGASAVSIGDVLSGGGWYVDGSQSRQAVRELAAAGMLGRGQTTVSVVVHDDRHDADTPQFEARVRQVVGAVEDNPALHVSGTYGWTTLESEARAEYLGRDRRTVVDVIAVDLDDAGARRELPKAQQELAAQFRDQDLAVSLVSPAALWGEMNDVGQEDLIRAELVALPLIAVILLLLYRSVVAAVTSLAVGGTAIAAALGVMSPIAHRTELSIFLQNTVTMLGLAIGVDYSLFIISRFREELASGCDVQEAVTRSLRTSGHTVVFSGITVVVTMAALFVVDLNVIQSIAVGAVVVISFSVLAATLVLPVLLHVIGHRINVGRLSRRPGPSPASVSDTGRWHAFTSTIMRRPVLFGLVTVLGLSALAVPGLELRTFTPDVRVLPHSSPIRQGYDLIQQQYGVGATSPLEVVVSLPAPITELSPKTAEGLLALHDQLGSVPHVVRVQSLMEVLRAIDSGDPLAVLRSSARNLLPADAEQGIRHYLSANGRTVLIELLTDGKASDDQTRAAVHAARTIATSFEHDGLTIAVGGETAEGIDANEVIQSNLGLVVLIMLSLVYLILLLTFRSVLLPLKAVAMNLLSLGATYGVMVLVFQEGLGTDLLGLTETGNLQNFIPILLLALLFSLSTDYEVFLLNRVRENYLRTGDNRDSVASGVQATAPLISGAAILMVAVFGAFSFTGMIPIEQLGFGMAVAVLIDATIIRLVLVPSTMRLMGRLNWWAPRFSRRPRVRQ